MYSVLWIYLGGRTLQCVCVSGCVVSVCCLVLWLNRRIPEVIRDSNGGVNKFIQIVSLPNSSS